MQVEALRVVGRDRDPSHQPIATCAQDPTRGERSLITICVYVEERPMVKRLTHQERLYVVIIVM